MGFARRENVVAKADLVMDSFADLADTGARLMIRRMLIGAVGAALLGACAHHAPEYPAPIPHVDGKPFTAFALREIDLASGTGAPVAPRKCLYANYTGWLTDGKKFDSSRDTMPMAGRVSRSAFRRALDA